MQKLFNHILIPLDLSSGSRHVIDKAIDIARQYKCHIHLLHVATLSSFSAVAMAEGHMSIPYDLIDNFTELEFQIKKTAGYIQTMSKGNIKVDYSILRGSWDETIIYLVNERNVDLVMIGQEGRIIKKRKMQINPDKIAAKTNVPVLTVPSNRRMTRLYSIVIPITDFLPVKKLLYGIYIASTYTTTVKLLGIETKATKDKVFMYLTKAHQLIQENSTVKVEKEIVYNENIAEAVNDFAMTHAADLVIVNPGSQSVMPGFLSALWGNIIQKYATPPVLTVNPV